MELGFFETLALFGVLLLVLYYYLTLNFNFWKDRNVPGPKPLPLFGNFKDIFLGKTHLAVLTRQLCKEFPNTPMIGIYIKSNPALIIRDPDLIKDVLIKDFNVFSDRGLFVSKTDPMNWTLLNLEYERWKQLRTKMTPVFTSAKLKDMFYLIADCATQFEKYIEKIAEKDESIECRELSAKFTIQTIGVCAFGLDTNAITDENNEFRDFGNFIFKKSFRNVARRLVQDFVPALQDLLLPLLRISKMVFFSKSIKDTIEYRRKNKVRRNDFLDLLMDLQEQPDKFVHIDFNDKFLIAQALIFFAAGFETSSTAMSNTFYELALNQGVQEKLRQDIRTQLTKNDGKLTYDCVKQMSYLDKVFKESLRKYPPGNTLQRVSVSTYMFSGEKVTIPKGTKILIPLWGIHHNPKVYPNPDIYDPDRFNEENVSQRHPMNYLPFGDGPHNCIGSRFANFQSKLGIISVVNNFKLDVCDKTSISYPNIEPRSPIPAPIGGLYLKISKLNEPVVVNFK